MLDTGFKILVATCIVEIVLVVIGAALSSDDRVIADEIAVPPQRPAYIEPRTPYEYFKLIRTRPGYEWITKPEVRPAILIHIWGQKCTFAVWRNENSNLVNSWEGKGHKREIIKTLTYYRLSSEAKRWALNKISKYDSTSEYAVSWSLETIQ